MLRVTHVTLDTPKNVTLLPQKIRFLVCKMIPYEKKRIKTCKVRILYVFLPTHTINP